jgi:hypothetical protein
MVSEHHRSGRVVTVGIDIGADNSSDREPDIQ